MFLKKKKSQHLQKETLFTVAQDEGAGADVVK